MTISKFLPSHLKKSHYISLFAILALGVLLRLVALDSKSLRLDEAQSVWQAMHSTEFIKAYMVKNVHLPLHNTLLHFWMNTFGASPVAVRMLAVIPGILSIPALYLLASEILGRNKAKYAMLLSAISPFWVWYSREIRMYSLLALMSTLSYYFYIKCIRENKARYYILYTLVSIIGTYTHYYFFMVLGIQGLYFLLTFTKKWGLIQYETKSEKTRVQYIIFQKLVLSAAIVFLVFAPWLNTLLRGTHTGSFGPQLDMPNAFNMFISFFEFVFGFQDSYITSLALGMWPLLLLMSFIFLEKRKNPFNPGLILVLMGTFIPVFLVYTVSVLVKPVYLTRYLTPVTPMLYVLLTWFIFEVPKKYKKAFSVIIITLMCLGLLNQFTDPKNPVREDYRDATEYISENATPRDIVFVAPPYNIYPVQYYYRGNARLTTLPYWDKRKGAIPNVSEEQMAKDIDALRPGHEKMYLLVSENLANTEEVLMYMNQKYTKIEKKEFSQDLWVHVYQAEYF